MFLSRGEVLQIGYCLIHVRIAPMCFILFPPLFLVGFPLFHVVVAGQCVVHRLVRVRDDAGVISGVGNTLPT